MSPLCVSGIASVSSRVCRISPYAPAGSGVLRASRIGRYNLDPALTFWATPLDHGSLTPQVVHPAVRCCKLPDAASAAQGAMAEPLAVCIQAVTKARIQPSDVAVVLGAGPVGLLQALAARAPGCSDMYIYDSLDQHPDVAAQYPGIHPLDACNGSPAAQIAAVTGGWGRMCWLNARVPPPIAAWRACCAPVALWWPWVCRLIRWPSILSLCKCAKLRCSPSFAMPMSKIGGSTCWPVGRSTLTP